MSDSASGHSSGRASHVSGGGIGPGSGAGALGAGTIATAAGMLTAIFGAGFRKIASLTKGIELLRPNSEQELLWSAAMAAQKRPELTMCRGSSADLSQLMVMNMRSMAIS
mmetsp:Transcript_175493/g.557391  ORF Transcript_175493/g.557391 Transcript_175493/m.557391 type:complete len:110 (+) Transcript_175493:184-513(+)